MCDPTWLIPDWRCDLCGSLSHETAACPLYDLYVEVEKAETPVVERESLTVEKERI